MATAKPRRPGRANTAVASLSISITLSDYAPSAVPTGKCLRLFNTSSVEQNFIPEPRRAKHQPFRERPKSARRAHTHHRGTASAPAPG